MNKNDLVDSLIEEHDLTRTFARDLVDSVFGSITDAARNGEEVSIFGFGKFQVTERGARKRSEPLHRRDHQDCCFQAPEILARTGDEDRPEHQNAGLERRPDHARSRRIVLLRRSVTRRKARQSQVA
jgi:nucleoid DNA-binding protein